MGLEEKIFDILNETEATFGISIKHLQTKEEVNINEDQLFQMASVFKVPILLTLYKQVHAGKIDLTKQVAIHREDHVPGSGILQEMDPGIEVTIKDLATLMTIVSDNLATDKIYHLVGQETIEKNMHDLGFTDISVKHSCWELLCLSVGLDPNEDHDDIYEELEKRLYSDKMYDDYVLQTNQPNNLCTPKAMTRLLELVANGEYVSQACSEDILDILFRQQLTNRIPSRLPYAAKVANKTGTLNSGVNDAGIVYLPEDKGAFIISVFSVGNDKYYKGAEIIARIAETAYEHFVGQ